MLVRKAITILTLVGATLASGGCSGSGETSGEQGTLPALTFADELQGALERNLDAFRGEQQLGISAALIVPGYRPWLGVSGYSRQGEQVTSDTLFDAGSVTKSFEACLALRLAEQGRFNLDDPISRWLPELPNVDGAITVRQLLNHTSGVFNVFEHPDFPWARAGIEFARKWDFIETFTNFVEEPYGNPGAVQHYSSTNYLLLTAILEKVSGSSVPAEIEHQFLRPLRLRHTFLTMGEPSPPGFRIAHPMVDLDQDGDLEDLSGKPVTWIASLTHPAIFTTAYDLALWMHLLYHERSVVQADSLEEMLTFPETSTSDPDGGLYGLGVVDYTKLLGIRAIGHGGSALGYSAAALYLPDYGASLAWQINAGESPRNLAMEIMGNTWSSLAEVIRAHLEDGNPG